ncbi:MAG: hypothetical protein ACTSV5_11085 [Promethearchaeota archaeon]
MPHPPNRIPFFKHAGDYMFHDSRHETSSNWNERVLEGEDLLTVRALKINTFVMDAPINTGCSQIPDLSYFIREFPDMG